MSGALFKGRFLCPECGSTKPEHDFFQEPVARAARLRRRYRCAECHCEIPVHLAERWGGISVEDAMREWRVAYRDPAKVPEAHASL